MSNVSQGRRATAVAASLSLVTLLAGAQAAEPKLNESVQVLVDHLEARTTSCPTELLASDIVDRTYCAAIDMEIKPLRKAVRKFTRKNRNLRSVQLGEWSELDGGLHAVPLLVGSLVLRMVFDSQTGTLLLIPHDGCMGDTGVIAPGLFEWSGTGLEGPERTKSVGPEYPERARAERVSGTVVLQAIIQKDGTVGDLCVVYVQPTDYGFAESTARALKQTGYKPATRDGEPIEVQVIYASSFSMN